MLPTPDSIDARFVAALAAMGALIGLGQLMNSPEPLTLRYALGRAIVSAGIAAAAPVALIWFPTMPKIAEFAFAALLASLGTSALVGILSRFTGGRSE